MRKLLVALGAMVALGAGLAVAGDPPAEKPAPAPVAAATPAPAPAPADPAAVPEGPPTFEVPDCTVVPEGDERVACEAKAKEILAAKAAYEAAEAAKASKTGKAARSNTNRMESEFSDE